MKRVICVCVLALCIIASALSASSFTLQSSRTYQSADSSGAYDISFSGSHVDITRYTSDTLSAGLNLSYAVSGVCAYHGNIVIFCDDTDNNQLIVYVYYLDSDILDSFALYGVKLYGDTDFCCDDNAVYIENFRDKCELAAYSYSGNLIGRHRFNQRLDALCCGYDSGVYAISNNTLYRLSGNSFTAIPGAEAEPPLFPAASDVLASAYGSVYVIGGGRILRSFSADSRFDAASACVIGNRLYYPCGSVINSYDLSSGRKVSMYHLSFDAALLYADGGSVTAVGRSLYTTVDTDDFVDLTVPDKPNHSGSGSSGNTGNGGNNAAALSAISSDVYHVDFSRYHITGILPETTVSQFKNNMDYNGWSVALYRDGSLRSGGSVGTAMTATFSCDSAAYTFELSVIGDITGEGNCNSRDMNLLLDQMIGSASFDGVYTIAADLSGDGTVNAVDAAILKRRIG